jgi:hypothetical protein
LAEEKQMMMTTKITTATKRWKGQRATGSSGMKEMKLKVRSRRWEGINSAGNILQNTFN